MIESIIRDIRHSCRILWKNPGFTAIIVVTLAVGIGANTAIFSLLDAVMLRSLPVQNPKSLVLLTWTAQQSPQTTMFYSWGGCPAETAGSTPGSCSFSYPLYEQIRKEQRVFSDVSAFVGPGPIITKVNGQSSRIDANFVSGNFFSTLGVQMALGRPLQESDDQETAEPTVVIGSGLWKREFGSDRFVIGRTILLQGTPFTVVGVTPPWFQGVHPGISRDLWLPLASQPQLLPYWPKQTQAKAFWVQMVARLQPGVTVEQGESALNIIFTRDSTSGPNKVFPAGANPYIQLRNAGLGLDTMRSEFKTPLLVLMAAVSVILLIACANVAGLLLVRSVVRQKETAMRLALGARPSSIFMQLLTEGLILTAIGGLFGTLFAYWVSGSIAGFLSANVEREINVHLDLRILLFTLTVSAVTAILFCVAPGFASTRVNLISALKLGGTISSARIGRTFHGRTAKILVVTQVAFSLVGLTGAGLLVRTLIKLETLNSGFDARNVLIFNVATDSSYKGVRLRNLYQDLQTRFASLPGVTSASYSSFPLLSGAKMSDGFYIPPSEESKFSLDILSVGPGFFETMRIPLLDGRTFTTSDLYSDAKSGPAVVNHTFAVKFFGKESPVGKHLIETESTANREIVGVVGDAKYDDLRNEIEPIIYFPLKEYGGSFELRVAGDPKALVPVVRSVIGGIDSNIPMFDVQTLTQQIQKGLYQERLVATLSSLFGILALTLASLGLYGLLSYDVFSRTRELGTRIALGARTHHIFKLVILRGIGLAIVGEVIGLAVAAGVTRSLQAFLYGVSSIDPVTFIVVAMLLVVVATVACYIPARRAGYVDPMIALRSE